MGLVHPPDPAAPLPGAFAVDLAAPTELVEEDDSGVGALDEAFLRFRLDLLRGQGFSCLTEDLDDEVHRLFSFELPDVHPSVNTIHVFI